jgi:hypothetical protein
LILNLKLKLTTTKPRIRTVDNHFEDYYDESEEEIDDLLAKLDLAKERTAKAATNLANTKEASLDLDSGLFAHMEAAECRAKADEAVTKETPVKPEGTLLSKLHSHFASMASPFTPQDSPALEKVSMDVTPRKGMNQHANDVHSGLFHPIDEAMIFGETPKTSERPDPFASFNTSPLLKGHNVNFESTNPFHYDGDKDGYPDFNLGTHPVTFNTAPVPVTHQAHSSVPSPATHQNHSAYVQNTSSVPSPVTHQAHSAYVQNTSSVPSPATHQAHPSVLPTVTQQATTSSPYLIFLPRFRILQPIKSILSLIKFILYLTKFIMHTSILHIYMSLAQLMLITLLRQRPSLHRMGRQCIRQVARISYRNRIRMI